MENIKLIVENFQVSGNFINASQYGSGLINQTLLVECSQDKKVFKYILRKINSYVFKQPQIVVQNTGLILEHMKNNLSASNNEDNSFVLLELIPNVNGKFSFIDEENNHWCMMCFLENTYSHEYTESAEVAFEAARCFGNFQKLCIDADLNKYKPTIPDFHNSLVRLQCLKKSIEQDSVNRVQNAKSEIELALSNSNLASKMETLLACKIIPIRLTHNDTKINNVLFNKNTKLGVCVVDFDTVMPGSVLFDFGDMVRTSTSPVGEDEEDISKVFVNIKIFRALVEGYLSELKGFLAKGEIDHLVYGSELITYEQAIRFLTDYLEGDIYYKIKYPEHNLIRARNQLALLKSLQLQKSEMESIVTEINNY